MFLCPFIHEATTNLSKYGEGGGGGGGKTCLLLLLLLLTQLLNLINSWDGNPWGGGGDLHLPWLFNYAPREHMEAEEEEEEELFAFTDTIEDPGRLRLRQGASLKPEEEETCTCPDFSTTPPGSIWSTTKGPEVYGGISLKISLTKKCQKTVPWYMNYILGHVVYKVAIKLRPRPVLSQSHVYNVFGFCRGPRARPLNERHPLS